MEDMAQRARFRQAGRRVLRNPSDPDAHEARVRVACALDGSEPLQGALADAAYAGVLAAQPFSELLCSPEVRSRLSSNVLDVFAKPVDGPQERVTRLATRYSVLAAPSLDVPVRSIRCGIDDSRRAAAEVIPALLDGDAEVEAVFLAHCEGALDVLAFMLARSAMIKNRRELSPRWRYVSEVLQRGCDP